MEFPKAPAPHIVPQNSVRRIMQAVLLAMTPGIAALAWQFGPGVLVQCLIAAVTAILAEAACQRLRGRQALAALSDYSALLTALLLAVSIPGLSPWWITVIGVLFAILPGKQVYGGLGYNPFNPAMVGYAALLVSFPAQLTAWPLPQDVTGHTPGLGDSLGLILGLDAAPALDALTGATPLDHARTQQGLGRTLDDIHRDSLYSLPGGAGWQWVNLGFLAGGLWLLQRGIIHWRIPASFLAALCLSGLTFHLIDPTAYPTPVFHLFSGATMLGAFFIATDPVTAATTPRGRLWHGAGIGFLVFVIRSWGGYPDGLAFAVLLLNLAAPTLDHYTRPRTYGHRI